MMCVYENLLHRLPNADMARLCNNFTVVYFSSKDLSEGTEQGALHDSGDKRCRLDAAAVRETCPVLL